MKDACYIGIVIFMLVIQVIAPRMNQHVSSTTTACVTVDGVQVCMHCHTYLGDRYCRREEVKLCPAQDAPQKSGEVRKMYEYLKKHFEGKDARDL